MRALIMLTVLTSCRPTLDIAGSDPDAPASRKLLVLAGQSNGGVGQQVATNISYPHRDGIEAAYPNVKLYQKSAQNRAFPPVWTTNTVGPLQSYTSSVPNNTGLAVNLMGAELSLGRHGDFYVPGGFDIAKHGMSGTSLDDWLNEGLLADLIAYVNGILTDDPDIELGPFNWVQGETDAQTLDAANAYQANLTAVIAALRSAWPDLHFVFNQLHADCAAPYTNIVRAAQAAVAAATAACTMISVDLLDMTDGYHFTADSYTALGDRLGAAVVQALGLENPLPFHVDPIMLVGFPADEDEWDAVLELAEDADGGPYMLWQCDEAAGDLADSIGAFTGTAAGAGITYNLHNALMERPVIEVAHLNNTAIISNTSAGLPDPTAESWMRFAYPYFGNPNLTRNLWFNGTSSPLAAVAAKVNGWRVTDGANNVDGASNPAGQFRPLFHQRHVPDEEARIGNNLEVVETPFGVVTGKRVTLFVGANVNAFSAHPYIADFRGAAAQRTLAQIKAIWQVLRWPVSWNP